MFDPSKYASIRRKVHAPAGVDRTDLRRVNRVPEKPYSKPEDQSPLLIPKDAFPPIPCRPRGNPTPRLSSPVVWIMAAGLAIALFWIGLESLGGN